MSFDFTKLGERGQVVIPKEIRTKLKLEKGERLVVLELQDSIMIKKVKPPDPEELSEMFRKAQQHAKKHDITEEDMWNAIKRVRKRKK